MIFEFKEFNDVRLKMSRINRLSEKALRKTWFKVGSDLKSTANKEVLRKPKSGRIYHRRTKSGRLRRHRASAPGETHANFTGRLRRNIGWKVKGRDLHFGYGVTQPLVPYGEFVELGTYKMRARPTLKNSINANRKNIEQHFVQALYKEFSP